MRILLVFTVFLPLFFCILHAQKLADYSNYHKTILSVEESIIEEDFREALDVLTALGNSYDFTFVAHYKIAAQLALYLQDFKSAFTHLRLGISKGWTLKEIKMNTFLKPLTAMKEWSGIEDNYEILRIQYAQGIDEDLRKEVRKMYKKDQKFAIKHFFRVGQKAKERHGTEKGEPHTRLQMMKLKNILQAKGYPGEKNIENSEWMTIILAHHNSLSQDFVGTDTLYPALRPRLVEAISKGEMNPYDLAFIEDWRIAVSSERQAAGYGFLNQPKKEELPKTDALRRRLNIRSVATRNALVDMQEKTGMSFYLAGKPWVEGKIIPKKQ